MTWEVQYPNLELEPPSPFPALDTSLILYGSTAKLEVEVVLRDPEVVLGDPEVVLGDLEVVLRDPEVGLGDLSRARVHFLYDSLALKGGWLVIKVRKDSKFWTWCFSDPSLFMTIMTLFQWPQN